MSIAIGLAITSLVTLFVSIWVLNIARDPKLWRMWWMDLIGVLDMDANRDLRRSQETQMSIICYALFFLLLLISLSCAFWTFDQMQEHKREKTGFERHTDLFNREMERLSGKPQGLSR